jgi:hypothetical protein
MDERSAQRNQETGCQNGPKRSFRSSAWMRADTHVGPEHNAPPRGLIHCCSSHVRRSSIFILLRTAGPYILAQSGHRDTLSQCPLSGVKRTFPPLTLMSAFDGEFNESTQHLLILPDEEVCGWRGMHGHGSRRSRRLSRDDPSVGNRIPVRIHKSMTASRIGREQQTRRLPSAGCSSGCGS